MNKEIDPGSVRLSKTWIALISLLILVLTTVSTAVAYTVGVKNTVDHIGDEMNDIQESIKEMQPRLGQNELDIAVIKAHYENIDSNIQDIKRTLEAMK